MRVKDDALRTRQSLLSKLRNVENHESWEEFFNLYWKLIYATALNSGLNDAEAQDVVQETVICVMRSMPGFKYDAANGSFKAWLRKLTRWRIVDYIRKRNRAPLLSADVTIPAFEAENSPDEGDSSFEAWWDEEWKSAIMAAAVERTKNKVDLKQFQIFELNVLRDWPVARVVKALKIKPSDVYRAKHRVGAAYEEELKALKKENIL